MVMPQDQANEYAIVVSLGCCDKAQRPCGFNYTCAFLTALEAESTSEIRDPAWLVPGEGSPPACRWLPSCYV